MNSVFTELYELTSDKSDPKTGNFIGEQPVINKKKFSTISDTIFKLLTEAQDDETRFHLWLNKANIRQLTNHRILIDLYPAGQIEISIREVGTFASNERLNASDWLYELLKSGEPIPAKDILHDSPFSKTTLHYARQSLGVRTIREGFGRGSYVLWSLPQEPKRNTSKKPKR
jgi:hypothetical protein